jgi:hypothetical protein
MNTRTKRLKALVVSACIGMVAVASGVGTCQAIVEGYEANGGKETGSLISNVTFVDGSVAMTSNYGYSYDMSGAFGNVALGNYTLAGDGKGLETFTYQKITLNPNNGEYDGQNGYITWFYDPVTKQSGYGKVLDSFQGLKGKDGKLYKIDSYSTTSGTYNVHLLDDNYQPVGDSVLYTPQSVSNATAVGNHAQATNYNSTAVGSDSNAQGYHSIAVGPNAQAGNLTDNKNYNDGISAIAVGDHAQAYGNSGIAVGTNSQDYGYSGIAIGNNAGANTNYAIAIGDNATVAYINGAEKDPEKKIAEQGIAIGRDSRVEGKDGTAVGHQALAKMENSTAYGNNSHADGYVATAVGNKSIAQGTSDVAVGNRATALDEYSTAVGTSTYAAGTHSVAVGDSNRATGRYSTAMGAGWSTYTVDETDNENTEKARNYKAIGANQATGDYSTAVGYGNAALGQNSSVFGMQNAVSGMNSLAYGSTNQVGTDRSTGATTLQDNGNKGSVTGFAVGNSNQITGNLSGSFGDTNKVSANNGYAIGNSNIVSGNNGFAAGNAAQATASNAIAVGTGAQSTLADSVALGSYSKTNEVIGTSVVEIPGTNTKYSNISGTSPVGTVSVGDTGKERTITNVAAGRVGAGSTDAVNGSELYAVEQKVGENSTNITNLNNKYNSLDSRINKVGAGAAALALLHPLDFDPDEKWDFASSYGHYRNANAAALGVFYRPNEDTMISVAGVLGDGNSMVGTSVSWKFGQHNHVSVNRVAMAKEIIELRKENNDLRSFMADSVSGKVLDLSKIQLFPDIPENHWAYDYVATLAGNGVLDGYPDGYFKGNRQMTRYEMAAVLYRAMLRGVRLSDRALQEFAPELDRIRVDTITKHNNGTPDIQRVRTIKGRE